MAKTTKKAETAEQNAQGIQEQEAHLDPAQLAEMEDEALRKLAQDMGLDPDEYAERDGLIAAIAEIPVIPGPAEPPEPEQKPERDVLAGIPNPCVYCGPSVRGVARQYTTYQGGIPEPLKEFIKAHPAARALIVAPAKFASMRKKLETSGTAEATIYKKVKAEL